MSLVCINVSNKILCRVVFFPAVFSAGRQTSLVAWTSFMPLDRFAARPDLPSLPVYPVDYRFLTPSTGLPDGRTFLPVFHNIVQIFFSVVLSITFVRS